MSYRDYSDNGDKRLERNPWPYLGFTLLMVMILLIRLFHLQVFNHDLYLNKSEDYRITRVVTEAPRGFVYDRNGEKLAANRMSYSVTVDPFERDELSTTIPHLASLVPSIPRLMQVSSASLLDTVTVLTQKSRNPAIILSDVDFETLSVIEEHANELPGVGCILGQRRYYPGGSLACHVLGYMGKLTRDEADRLVDDGYDRNQWIGRYGVERFYETSLRGENGLKFLEKNYLNRILGDISGYQPVPATPGGDVTLTIDSRLQAVAESCFADTLRGALVALDPRTGEVLALVSSPSFDPNTFVSVMDGTTYASLVNDPEKPLYNRAIQGLYPPGSPFKPITALAGLVNGVPASTRFQPCYGSYTFGRVYHCWDENGHGSLDMIGAIEQSCNVYFYQLGRRVGLDAWAEVCGKMGFGRVTGIDLPGEEAGILPSHEFYDQSGIVYSPGMILNLSIGQGENNVTPLQLAHYCGILATNGLDARPHLLKTGDVDTTRVEGIPPEAYAVVREGMRLVINGEHGTAKSGRVPGHIVAGKTGTAQNPHGADHKIFMGFAPFDDPTVALACVVENAGDYDVSLAVQFSRQFLTSYFTFYPDPTIDETAQ